MQKKVFISLSVLLLSLSEYSQSIFQKAYQKDFSTAYGGQQTSDGGYIMAGLHQVSATDFDYLAVKTNSGGDTLWTGTYGGIGDEESYAMQQTSDGGYIMAGIDSSSGLGSYNVYLVKLTATGDTSWTRSYGGSGYDFGQAIQQTADGGYIVAGYTGSFGAGNADVYLLKTDANGNLTWSKTYGGPYGDYAFSVKQTTDGGYIMTGITSSFGISPYGNVNDVYVLKTDANGTLTWSKTYGQNGDDWSYGVVQTNTGGYAITGHTNVDSTASLSNLYLIKTDVNGDTLFTKSYGGNNYDKGIALMQTGDSGFAIAGSTYSFGHGASDVYFIKTNTNGTIMYNSTFGSGGNDWAYAIAQAADGGFALTGYTDNYGVSNSSFYLVKTDLNGNGNNCNQTNPVSTPVATATKVNNAATVTNTPSTLTGRNTHTVIGKGLSVVDVCSITTGIKQGSINTLQASIYPNPSNGIFTLKTDNLADNTQVIIYNQLGQIILSKQVNGQFTGFNLDATAGIYQIRVIAGNDVIYQTKIIKE
jgi:hypothetical protein